ncbi:MAG: CCA tRNA nucleotidyltransferase [Planctomycetes bacterium]|nr:CCA tRNA nucleotidyltransferase [Planctomycetota bacterium]
MTNRELAILVIRTLRRCGHEALLAGGCVRDRLLGRRPKDYDVATSARPDEVQRLFRKTLAIGAQFGVIVVLRGKARVEVATFRNDDPYRDGRHPTGVRFTSAEEDARRRDFTINALFYDPLSRKTIDYVGGLKDLERGVVRAVGDAEERFREDHLRMLRAVRFSARLGFPLHRATARAIRKLAPLIKRTSGERVRDELAMMLTDPSRSRAMEIALRLGLLEQVLPEVAAMKGCKQGRAHPEGDVWRHTMFCLEALERPDFVTALATLLHDVGKPPTADYSGGGVRFYGHQQAGAGIARDVAARLKLSTDQTEQLAWVVHHHMDFMQVHQMRQATLKRLFQSPHFPALARVHRADALGSRCTLADHRYVMRAFRRTQAEGLKPRPLVTGHDLLALGMRPGPAMGQVLNALYDSQLEGSLRTRRAALAAAKRMVAEQLSAGADKQA